MVCQDVWLWGGHREENVAREMRRRKETRVGVPAITIAPFGCRYCLVTKLRTSRGTSSRPLGVHRPRDRDGRPAATGSPTRPRRTLRAGTTPGARWHGGGVFRARAAAGPPGGDQAAAVGTSRPAHGAGAFPARSPH